MKKTVANGLTACASAPPLPEGRGIAFALMGDTPYSLGEAAALDEMIDRINAALADRYHVLQKIGEGGMATVYLAEDLRHERNVALKVLKPALQKADTEWNRAWKSRWRGSSITSDKPT